MLMLDRQTTLPDVDLVVEAGFDFLSDEYRALYARSDATAFQAPLWMDMLNRTLAPRLAAIQRTITVRTVPDGQLVAVMPFVLQKSLGVRMMLPADFGLCDYNALVAEDSTLDALARSPSVRKSIARLLGGADLMLFRKVRSDGFDVSRLFQRVATSPSDHAAYLCEFGDDFAAWTATLSKSISNRLPRQFRQVEQKLGRYEHRLVRDEREIRDAFAFLKRVREGRFENDLLGDPLYADFYLDYAIASAKTGEAGLYVGYIAGQPVSFLFGLQGGRHFHAVQLGTDRGSFNKYSVGNQVYFHAMRDQFDSGQRALDMGIGNVGYKDDFRPVQIPMRNFTSAQTLRGSAVAAIYHRAKPLKNQLRRLVPRVH